MSRSMVLIVMIAAGVALFAACGGGGGSPRESTMSPTDTARLTALAVATTNTTAAAASDPPLVKVSQGADGKRLLTDLLGKTLYVSDADRLDSGASSCTGDCAVTWPPLTIPFGYFFQIDGLGLFGQFLRKDGPRQVMYKGRPLYYYSGDKAPGDTGGAGKDGRWSIARP